MPLVSLVSLAVPVRCFGVYSACSACGVLGVCIHVAVSLGDSSGRSATGVLGVAYPSVLGSIFLSILYFGACSDSGFLAT